MSEGNLKLSVYDRFTCVADKCPYTCCRDWDVISVDAETIEVYRMDSYVIAGIDEKRKSFITRKQDFSCCFLNKDLLCDLVLRYGPDVLCYTCTTFPRVIMRRTGLTEYTLSNGCAEVLHLLDMIETPLPFMYDEETFPEVYLAGEEVRIRDCMISILQQSGLSLNARLQMMYMFVDRLETENLDNALSFFSRPAVLSELGKRIGDIPGQIELIISRLHVYFNAFAEKCARYQPFHEYLEPFCHKDTEFDSAFVMEKQVEFDQWLKEKANFHENICVNFTFRHFAETDVKILREKVIALAMEMVLSAYTIFLNMLLKKKLDDREVYIIYSFYARIIEHNEESIKKFTTKLLSELGFNAASFYLIVRFLQYT